MTRTPPPDTPSGSHNHLLPDLSLATREREHGSERTVLARLKALDGGLARTPAAPDRLKIVVRAAEG
jgi:hypothetical protein